MAFLFAWRKRKQILRDFADLSYQLSYMNALIANDVSNAVLLCAIDDQDAFELICYALANCSTNVAEKYREYLKKLMNFSVAEFREIFSKVIQPVLRIDKHPLGSMLLDEFLREFDNAAERDIWWSIPSYLKDKLS